MIRTPEEATEENLQIELEGIAQKLGFNSLEDATRFPRLLQIEPIRHCNAKCPFCTVEQWDMTTPRMSDELFSKLVDELADYTDTVRWVNLQRAGEPLLDTRLPDWIARLKDAGIKMVNISTNASLLTEKKSRELLSAGLDELMISIDSVEKEEYEQLRVGLDYETVIENIKRFFDLRNRLRPETSIRVRGLVFKKPGSPEYDKTVASWEAYWNRYRQPQDRVYMRRPHSWGNQIQWEDKLPVLETTYNPCMTLWASLQITTSGKAALCSNDMDSTVTLGDVNVQSMAEVWQGAVVQRLRRLHATGRRNEIPLCVGCWTFEEASSLEKDPFTLFKETA